MNFRLPRPSREFWEGLAKEVAVKEAGVIINKYIK
jgi:hypothetical protein